MGRDSLMTNHEQRYIAVRHNNQWHDRSKENYETSKKVDEGQNRVRVNNQWRQAPKMLGDDVDE